MTSTRLLAAITNPVIDETIGANTDGGAALGELLGRLYRATILVGGLALLLYIIWGGLNWITAAGDEKKVELAKDRLTHSIIGMGVLVGGAAIANFVGTIFGLDLLNPTF